MSSLSGTFLGAFLSFVLLYKYAALFLIAYVAALLLPVPASSTLAAASGFASQGYLNFPGVLAVAWIGNIAGDATGYLLARHFGESFLEKTWLRRLLHSKRYGQVKSHIYEFPQSLIFFTRFLTELGPAVNILSGLSNVPPKTFFTYDLLGEAAYVLLYGSLGYYLGTQFENSTAFFAKTAVIMLPIGTAIYLLQIYLYRRRRAKQ